MNKLQIEFEKDLYWIAQHPRNSTARQTFEKWKKYIHK